MVVGSSAGAAVDPVAEACCLAGTVESHSEACLAVAQKAAGAVAVDAAVEVAAAAAAAVEEAFAAAVVQECLPAASGSGFVEQQTEFARALESWSPVLRHFVPSLPEPVVNWSAAWPGLELGRHSLAGSPLPGRLAAAEPAEPAVAVPCSAAASGDTWSCLTHSSAPRWSPDGWPPQAQPLHCSAESASHQTKLDLGSSSEPRVPRVAVFRRGYAPASKGCCRVSAGTESCTDRIAVRWMCLAPGKSPSAGPFA